MHARPSDRHPATVRDRTRVVSEGAERPSPERTPIPKNPDGPVVDKRDVLLNPLDARAPRWSPIFEALSPRDFEMMPAAPIPQQ